MKFKSKAPQNEVAQVLVSFKQAFRNIGVFSAVINMLMLMPAIYMLQLYDSVLTSRNEMTLYMLTLIMLVAYIFMGALEYVRSFVLIRVGAQLGMKLNKRVYTAAFEQSLKQGDGDVGQALKDLTNLRQFLTGNALFAFFDALDFEQFKIHFEHPNYQEKAQYEFALVKQLRVNGFPTLLLQTGDRYLYLLSRGYSDYPTVSRVFESVLLETSKKHISQN